MGLLQNDSGYRGCGMDFVGSERIDQYSTSIVATSDCCSGVDGLSADVGSDDSKFLAE